MGMPKKLIIFSRDEAKQHEMRLSYMNRTVATDDIIYQNFEGLVEFRIGDVRDLHSVASALKDANIVINTAALKQVPSCEYFPFEAVQTNIAGPENIVRAIRELALPVETVVGVSTDKACKPINVMGMTKAIQERVFTVANLTCRNTRFLSVRYGNVLASRGSVIPLFESQIRAGGPITITTEDMTRFLLSIDRAVDTVFAAVREGNKGEIYIPRVRSANVIDIARIMMQGRDIEMKIIGIRPGEKIHEILVSDEESHRTVARGEYFAIKPIVPELVSDPHEPVALTTEYSSADTVMENQALEELLATNGFLTVVPEQPAVERIR